MMDWTDRHCRAFHRPHHRRALLYTEMVTTGAGSMATNRAISTSMPRDTPSRCNSAAASRDPGDLRAAG